MGRSLLILLYYTGCRPVEALALRPNDFRVEVQNLVVDIPGRKRGVGREIYLPLRNNHIKELRVFAIHMPPDSLVFYRYVSTSKNRKVRKDGTVYYNPHTTNKLYWHFSQWFNGFRGENTTIPPYFLRHNAMSRLAELGHSEQELKYLKGARNIMSVSPYVHLSSLQAKKLSKGIAKI